MVAMKLLLSGHARKSMSERGIPMEEVAEAIQKGRKWRQADRVHASIRNVEVVYKVENSEKLIIEDAVKGS
jgi:hypothetical protein